MEYCEDSVFGQTYEFESDLIDIKEYFGDFAKSLVPVERCQHEKCKNVTNDRGGCGKENCKNDEFYRSFLGITQEELKELKERTSTEHLTCTLELESIPHDLHKKFDDSVLLKAPLNKNKTIQSNLESVKKRAEMITEKNNYARSTLKYCNYQWCVNYETHVRTHLIFNEPNCSSVVITVKVYCPFESSKNKPLRCKLLQEIQILGHQTLSDLKDKIVCSLDYIGDKDLSNECFLRDVGVQLTAKDEYPSSFIFIENTFYNDMRTPKMIDLSKEVREWASGRNLGPFNVSKMEDAQICDIKLRLGHPYVYQHQGNCEHLIVFSDMRFLDFNDSFKSSWYPRTHSTGRTYGKHCMMCADSYARWLVVGNERLTHDRAYLCNKCFISYNYINGQRIGEFEAYKYVDPIALL